MIVCISLELIVHGSLYTHLGVVYNITHYLSFHPGGHNELMRAAGTDCTLLFNQVYIRM